MSQTPTRSHRQGSLWRPLLRALLAAALSLSSAPAALAQTSYGRLTVYVYGRPGGAVARQALAGTVVTLTNLERGTRRTCAAGRGGRCVFGALSPGYYLLEVADAAGGALLPQREEVRVSSGQRLTRSFTLTDTASISARAAAPADEVAVPSLQERIIPERRGETVTKEIEQAEPLPRPDQRLAATINLLPGAFETADAEVGRVLFNGLSQNVFREGGVDTTPLELRSASFQDTGALIFDPSKRQSFKKYKSFRIDTNNYPAGLGTGTGAELIGDVDSGGREFGGEAYGFFTHDALGSRDFFDFADRPRLRFGLFGVKLGGPLLPDIKDDVFPQLYYFVNYEGLRASSGHTIFEAAPSLAARGRAVPEALPLVDAFRAGGAQVVAGATADPDFDVLRLDARNVARRDSLTTHITYSPSVRNSLGFLYFVSGSTEDTPDGVTGRRVVKRDLGHTLAVRFGRDLRKNSAGEATLTNEFIFGLNSNPARLRGRLPEAAPATLSGAAFAVGGEVTQTGINGLGSSVPFATPGAMLAGSDFGGVSLRFTPTTYTFLDQLVWQGGSHTVSFGGEMRLVRASLDQIHGLTYGFDSAADLLANRPASVQLAGNLGTFTGAPGARRVAQEYYIAYAQDEWDVKKNLRLTYGLRYEYYTPLREARDRAVLFDTATGGLLPPGAAFYRSRKDNSLPRLGLAWAPRALNDDLAANPTVISASFGMHVGPDPLDNVLRPVLSDRLRVEQPGGLFPTDPAALAAAFAANADDRRYTPLAIARDYTSPGRVYKFDVTLKRDLIGRLVSGDSDNDDADILRELFFVASYVGNRGRGLPLRNFANRIVSVETNADPTLPAVVRREFDIVRDGRVLSPFGEVEYLTTGGQSNYDSLQLSLRGRARRFVRLFQAQYTLARSRGNTDGDEPLAAGDAFDYDYDFGYSAADVRHKFSFGTVLLLDCARGPCADTQNRFLKELLGNWIISAIGNFQTGSPIDLRLKRPDVVYLDGAGNVFTSPAAGRSAVLNLPGGGSSVAALRPNLVPGVNPYLGGFGGRRRYLNPLAFSIPAPGQLGDLPRGALRGPGVRLVDLSVKKEFALSERTGMKSLTFNVDVTNVFNFTNFKFSAATLPNRLGTDTAAHQLQPGQPFTAEAAEGFGIMTRTYKRKQDLAAGRQLQFGISLNF